MKFFFFLGQAEVDQCVILTAGVEALLRQDEWGQSNSSSSGSGVLVLFYCSAV